MDNCTYIDGIASSEAIDTAGEIVDLMGLDCSSLVGGALNWEHKSDIPSQIVGKVLKIKKIFTDADCENDRQKYYWEKCKIPFLYVLGRLFDDKKDSSKEVAALFQDDAQHPNEPQMVGFSIEGAKINKEGLKITRSIARRVTITNCPANKTCIAEMVPAPEQKASTDVDSIFKTEAFGEVRLFKAEENTILEMIKKEDPTIHAKALGIAPMKKDGIMGGISQGASSSLSGGEPSSAATSMMGSEKMKKAVSLLSTKGSGTKIGTTQSGKDVTSHGHVGSYNFASQDHFDAAKSHFDAAKKATDMKAQQHHNNKGTLHFQAGKTMQGKEGKRAELQGQKNPKSPMAPQASAPKAPMAHPSPKAPQQPKSKKLFDPGLSKALEAGSGLAAPSNLIGGASLIANPFGKKKKKNPDSMMITSFQSTTSSSPAQGSTSSASSSAPGASASSSGGMGKSDLKKKWLARAEEEYNKWEKREQFEQVMSKSMPHLSKGEIKAIGQTFALKKSMEAEKTLAKMANLEKSAYKIGDTHYSGDTVHSAGHSNEEAMHIARKMRNEGTHASAWHHSGPKTGKDSKYIITVPKKK